MQCPACYNGLVWSWQTLYRSNWLKFHRIIRCKVAPIPPHTTTSQKCWKKNSAGKTLFFPLIHYSLSSWSPFPSLFFLFDGPWLCLLYGQLGGRGGDDAWPLCHRTVRLCRWASSYVFVTVCLAKGSTATFKAGGVLHSNESWWLHDLFWFEDSNFF